MNCEDFSQVIHELADYKPMQATVRDAAMSHVALCADCAAKLAESVAVSRDLVLAASAESESAPLRVKQNLLAAFTELHETEPATLDLIDQRVVSLVDVRARKLRWMTAAAISLAAAILIAVILPIWKDGAQPNQTPQSNVQAGVVEPPRLAADEIHSAPPALERKPDGVAANDGIAASAGRSRRVPKPRRLEARARQTETVAPSSGEYLALTYLAKTTAFESGTVVRVELSRSALASLGLPVTFEGSATSVKADVVIGDDGVAQAIRLVQ